MKYSISKNNNKLYITQYSKSIGSGMIIDLDDLTDKELLEIIAYCQEELQEREENGF